MSGQIGTSVRKASALLLMFTTWPLPLIDFPFLEIWN
jgi:hypothetical protein